MDNYGLKTKIGNTYSWARFRSGGLFGRKFFRYLLVLTALLIAVLGIRKLFFKNSPSSGNLAVQDAKAQQEINKEFSFPLLDSEGNEVSRVKYVIENAEARDEIIVKGQKAKAVEGRDFLVLTVKITNEYNRPIQINSRDYVRLSVNGNESEWLAPDIHNDPVEVQAISTKYTRIGFPINDDDKKLVLRIGEVKGDKENLELSLK